jgi:probable F420-dependent oxidoreductase
MEAYAKRTGRDPARQFAVGDAGTILDRVGEYVAGGVQKFILRPVGSGEQVLAQTRTTDRAGAAACRRALAEAREGRPREERDEDRRGDVLHRLLDDAAGAGVAAEERGFDSVWSPEHSHIPLSRESAFPSGGELPKKYYDAMDPFVALMAAAAVTKTIKVGTGVCLVAQRDPIQTAKQVASIDQLSNGRFLFGIGNGWNKDEMRNHGTGLRDPPQAGARAGRGDEGDLEPSRSPSITARLVNFDPMMTWPKPAQKPHPPILVGGAFPYAARRAIRYGDGWMPHRARPHYPNVRDFLPEFRKMAAAANRDLPVTIWGAKDEDMLKHDQRRRRRARDHQRRIGQVRHHPPRARPLGQARREGGVATRNRSSVAGRTSSAALVAGSLQVSPRTSTTGCASSAWPITSDAAAAISSAKAEMVTCSVRPNRSGLPRRSSIAGSPAAPIATPVVPRRHGRPKLSMISTAVAPSLARSASALASGSTGRSSARSTPSCGATFDWSMPALAMTKPALVLDDQHVGPRAHHPHRFRQDQLDQPRVLLAPRRRARSRACDGVTLAISTMRPSALEHDLLRQHQHVALAQRQLPGQPLADQAREIVTGPSPSEGRNGQQLDSLHQPYFFRIRGATCSANNFRNRAWSGPGAWNTRCLKPSPT